jgi:hypothetical protein
LGIHGIKIQKKRLVDGSSGRKEEVSGGKGSGSLGNADGSTTDDRIIIIYSNSDLHQFERGSAGGTLDRKACGVDDSSSMNRLTGSVERYPVNSYCGNYSNSSAAGMNKLVKPRRDKSLDLAPNFQKNLNRRAGSHGSNVSDMATTKCGGPGEHLTINEVKIIKRKCKDLYFNKLHSDE